MRGLRVAGLVVVLAVTGLVSSGAAVAGPSTAGADGETVLTVAQPAGIPAPPVVVGAVIPAPAVPVIVPAPVVPAPVVPAPVVPAPVVPAPLPAPVEAPAVEAPPVEPPAPVEPPEPREAAGTPCASTARACVDLSGKQAWLIDGGEVTYGPVPITSGRKGYRTPPGTFTVDFKNIDHVSSIYDAPMPYSVFFNGGIAFHQGSLSEKSHGCIHLSRKAAKNFYGSLGVGDVVQVVS